MATEPDSVTACLVVHDNVDDLPALLSSLKCQTRPVDQLVVCLTGNPDLAIDLIEEAMPGAVIIERPENPGFSGGINACLGQSTGSHLLLLNPDVVLGVDYVELCLGAFENQLDVAGVGGLLLRSGSDGQVDRIDSAGFASQPWFRIVDRGADSKDTTLFQEQEDVIGICAAAALFSRAALESVAEDGKVMDEDFWMYKEDQDLCLRLSEAGYRLVFEPRAKSRHGRGWARGNRFQVPLILRRHSLKNRYLILAKHWRIKAHLLTLPVLVLFEAFLWIGLVLRDPKVLVGYWWAAKLLPRMLNKRKHLGLRLLRRRKETGKLRPNTNVAA